MRMHARPVALSLAFILVVLAATYFVVQQGGEATLARSDDDVPVETEPNDPTGVDDSPGGDAGDGGTDGGGDSPGGDAGDGGTDGGDDSPGGDAGDDNPSNEEGDESDDEPVTEVSVTPRPDAAYRDFLRENGYYRPSDETQTHCDQTKPESPSAAWIMAAEPVHQADLYYLCAMLPGGPDNARFTLLSPSDQAVSSFSVVRDAEAVLATTSERQSFALIVQTEPGGERRYGGSTETLDVTGQLTHMLQVPIELSEQRPEGDWTLTVMAAGQSLTGTSVIHNFCTASPPANYAGADPVLLDPGRPRIDRNEVVLATIENCRVIRDDRGRPFSDVVAEYTNRATYGDFAVAEALGHCGFQNDDFDYDNAANRLDFVSRDYTTSHQQSYGSFNPFYYRPGETLRLHRTIACPPFPEVLMEQKTTSAGATYMGARPLPIGDVVAIFEALRDEYPDWQWELIDCDHDGALVERYDNPGPSPPNRLGSFFPHGGVALGDLIPVVRIECDR